jgi:hypothetical protein
MNLYLVSSTVRQTLGYTSTEVGARVDPYWESSAS